MFDEDSYSNEVMLIVENLFEQEDIECSDFIIRQMPNQSQESVPRKVVENIVNCTISDKAFDDLNESAQKQTLLFELLSKFHMVGVKRNHIYNKNKQTHLPSKNRSDYFKNKSI